MKAKKSPRANLENKRIIFAQIGMIITLALVLLAFEWKTYDDSSSLNRNRKVDLTPEELAIITVQSKPPPPPKPFPITTLLNEVGNDIDIDIDIDIDVEANAYTEMPEYIPDYKDEEPDPTENTPFKSVQEMPSFPGGDIARIAYLRDNINYPLIAKETGIQGNVYVSFVVERDGSISNIGILKGIGGGCDEEAIRVIANMPKWNPGKQRTRPVRVRLNMHIVFKLL